MDSKEKYSLALDFHENSKVPLSSQKFDHRVQYKIYPNSKTILLDNNQYLKQQCDNSLLHTLFERKSTRDFSPENVELKILSRLLTLSFGRKYDEKDPKLRTYASAGARYPIEVYVIMLRSDDIELGIYHHNIWDNTLEIIKTGDFTDEVTHFYSNQSEYLDMKFPCLILFSMIQERTMQKYGERGYRFILIDAGHMSQNLYLIATYLNLGVVALGAGIENDGMLDDILGLSYNEESAFYGFAVGYPQKQ